MQRTRGCHPSLFLVVARAPVPGATKTRLGLSIGMDRAVSACSANDLGSWGESEAAMTVRA